MSGPAFYDEVRALRLDRVLDVAVALVAEVGWDRLSMVDVSRASGVPRQSLYKEVGTKADLGAAVVRRDVDRFLVGVHDAVTRYPDSVVDGLGAAVRFVLEHGQGNVVLRAVTAPGRDAQLLELVAVHPQAVLQRAVDAVRPLLASTAEGTPDGSKGGDAGGVPEEVVDLVVRLTLSHLLQPTVSLDEAVDRIVRAARGLLQPAGLLRV